MSPIIEKYDENWKNFETLESYIFKSQKAFRSSRGEFSDILRRIAMASKIIASKLQRAGLINVLGKRGLFNPQGEEQMKLDHMANEIMKAAFSWMPSIAGIATEEEEDFVAFPRAENYTGHRYVVVFDPLDGSSNLDANVSVGTIFSIYRCLREGEESCTLSDFLQGGHHQAAAGYVLYGPSTMFVYTTGNGVHSFTLDPEVGEFVLSNEFIRTPPQCHSLSVNESNFYSWDQKTKDFIEYIKQKKEERYNKTSSRYVGSLVSDFHRNLVYGGIFLYPSDTKSPHGKLRLLYEAYPLAMIAEQALGKSTTGTTSILNVVPDALHQRTPFIVGNAQEVDLYESFMKKNA